ncbi:MAG: DUF2071 domain-containing protein [Bacteroidota bacterium]
MLLLKRHPFAVEAFFRQSLVLTFAFPVETLAPLLPPTLQLDTYNDRYAFVAVAMVQTEGLRPKGFPKWLGNDFFLSGYRIFTRYTNRAGKRLRGLYILESQTDKVQMATLGNLMTHYNYRKISVTQERSGELYTVHSPTEGFHIVIREDATPSLPKGSPFTDWKQARRFAGPLPFTFTYVAAESTMLIVEGVRQNWTPKPVTVAECTLPWLANRGFATAQLASAFVVKDIPYYWKKGQLEKWQP